MDTALAVSETPLLGISGVSDTTDVATKIDLIVSGPETPEIYFFVRYIGIIMGLLCTVLCN